MKIERDGPTEAKKKKGSTATEQATPHRFDAIETREKSRVAQPSTQSTSTSHVTSTGTRLALVTQRDNYFFQIIMLVKDESGDETKQN